MEFRFVGKDIKCAIDQKIEGLKVEIKNVEKDKITNRDKYKEWENLKDKWVEEGNRLEEEYYKIFWLKRLFTIKDNYIDGRRIEKYPGFAPLYDMECATIANLRNKIKTLEKEKCLFDQNKEYVLDLKESKKYGLDEYLCEKRG